MLNKIFQRKILLSDIAVLVYVSLIKLLIHILTGSQYGYFRDELYYIEASQHLDFGYVDIPPLVPLIMAVNRFIFGTSLMAIHILPALAGAVTVFITGLTAKKLGGGRFAQILAAVAFLTGGNWLVMNSMFTYDSFDQLMSSIFFYVLIVILKDEKPKLWPLFGLIAGIGLMTKLSMMFIGFAMVCGLLLTKERRQFMKKWIWIGGLVVILVCMPYILWQLHHGAPVLEYWKNYAEGKTLKSSPLEFILNQVADIGALSAPIWICGLYYFLFSKDGKKLRVLGLIYIILLVMFAAMHMKPYLLSPEYIVLFAAGGVVIEGFINKIRSGWLKPVYLSLLVVLCVITAPLALPILPIDRLGSYMQMLGVKSQKIEVTDTNDLPNHLIDRFGWEEMVKRVSEVYGGLSKEDRD
ncbi:MAG TPA: glycosyltransferase family 39 protein, partial [Clostridia bacterium]